MPTFPARKTGRPDEMVGVNGEREKWALQIRIGGGQTHAINCAFPSRLSAGSLLFREDQHAAAVACKNLGPVNFLHEH
jgi:hypothetical protein